jgi:hypothetical protein
MGLRAGRELCYSILHELDPVGTLGTYAGAKIPEAIRDRFGWDFRSHISRAMKNHNDGGKVLI